MVKIFSGSAHPQLSLRVTKLLRLPLSIAHITHFDNSEVKVTIKEEVKNQVCFIIQPTCNPTDTHLMELFFFCDALRRQEAKKVIGIIPYFGYARQDIQHQPGECVSVNVIIRFLETIGFDKIYTVDLHDEATEGVFSIPFKNLTALPLLADAVKKYLFDKKLVKPGNLIESIAITSPDQGGIERTRKFSLHFFKHEKGSFSLSLIEKKRNLAIAHQSKTLDLYGEVKNKIVIIVDDIITSGTTLINAANLCLKKGAKKVIAAVVHHDLSPKAPSLIQNSPIELVFTTDSIPFKNNDQLIKFKEISLSTILAEEIKHVK
jgi:ribose-phosphate pyrophosphokinase